MPHLIWARANDDVERGPGVALKLLDLAVAVLDAQPLPGEVLPGGVRLRGLMLQSAAKRKDAKEEFPYLRTTWMLSFLSAWAGTVGSSGSQHMIDTTWSPAAVMTEYRCS